MPKEISPHKVYAPYSYAKFGTFSGPPGIDQSIKLLLQAAWPIKTGTLKTRDWKTQDWKTWDQIAGVEKAGLENAGTSCVWVAKCNINGGDPRTLQEAIQSGN